MLDTPLIVTPDQKQVDPLEARLPSLTTKALVEAYFARLGDDYRALIKDLCSRIEEMNSNCGQSFALPVAAHEELGNPYRALLTHTVQSAKKESFEAVVVANHHEHRPGHAKATLKFIDDFQKDFPAIKVHPLYVAFDAEPTMGFIRSLSPDVIAMRYLQRACETEDHLITSINADSCGHPVWFVEDALNIGSISSVKFIAGNNHTSPYSCASSPLLLFNTILDLELKQWLVQKKKSTFYSGASDNSTFKLSSYCEVGGYPRDHMTSEDMVLKQRIRKRFKKQLENPMNLGRNTFVYAGARRSLLAVRQGIAMENCWVAKGAEFGIDNAEIRIPKARNLEGFFDELVEGSFFMTASEILNMTLNKYRELGQLTDRDFPEVIDYLAKSIGFWLVDSGSDERYQIKEEDSFRNRLVNHRENYVDNWRYDTYLDFDQFFSSNLREP